MNIQRMLAGLNPHGGQQNPAADTPQVDTAEQIYISSLALLKMLKHGAEQNQITQIASGPSPAQAANTPLLRPQVAPACLWRSWA